ncbi:MAG: neutral/alkaline non-lysosomal ceramidase N-terminal domain-containing protein [Planctomycetes bacterium]|nr:neutral/alkaline non-lysosomal ceramidase N-terminal domain-containing protein [Planctomycetota bacterium]
MRFLTALLLFTTTSSAQAQEPAKPWKAGLGKAIITPQKPMWMAGYASRDKPAESKLHDLWAKALILEDTAGKRAVLVTLDLVGIDRAMSRNICKALRDRFGFARENIILSVSHTHTGPVVGNNLNEMFFLAPEQQARVKEYADFLPRQIVKAVADADKNTAAAEISWGIGRATFAVNRRNNKEPDVPKLKEAGQLKGPVDHDVPVLTVCEPGGRLRGIVFGYACHATVLAFFQWSGDYPGFAQIELEKAHPGAVAMFFGGCGGDQNPLPRRTVALAEDYGKQLARAVESVIEKKALRPVGGVLSTRYAEIPLPFGELPSREELAVSAQSKNKHVAHQARKLLEKLQEKQEIPASYPYPVQVWSIGADLDLVALGGEVVVEYALRIKKELRPGKTWVMGYANDVMAYIPSLRVLKEGGYEGGGAMVYYGLPTVWSPRVEETIIEAVHAEAKKTRAR